MNKQPTESWDGVPEENPALNGPDYIALVIEWDDSAALDDRTVDRTVKTESAGQQKHDLPVRKIAIALGAALLAGWGIHRLRRTSDVTVASG